MGIRIEVAVADITTLDVDAIVNAANDALAGGGGVCGAIFAEAGPEMDVACDALGGCPTGEARMTAGFDLPARHVIHAVGPIWSGGGDDERLLASCYTSSLRLAAEHDLQSIAFPAISTGIFGYPIRAATMVAVRTVRAWLETNPSPAHVIFCCFSEGDAEVYRETLAVAPPDLV